MVANPGRIRDHEWDMRFSRAIVRIPGLSYADGLSSAGEGRPDIPLARAQHARYCQALRDCGLELTVLSPDEAAPDGTFVEDTAVIAGRVAIVTRPGAATRRGEVAAISAALQPLLPVLGPIEAPGTLDGGDVCQADEHFFIGLSARTNAAGAAQLAALLARHGYTASTVDIRAQRALLHLKSGISYLGERRFVALPGAPRSAAMAGYEFIETSAGESYAANCVRVNDEVLVAAGYPQLADRLDALGYAVRQLEMSEFRKMDGGLSCLSLRC
jgi:dimethylargininase